MFAATSSASEFGAKENLNFHPGAADGTPHKTRNRLKPRLALDRSRALPLLSRLPSAALARQMERAEPASVKLHLKNVTSIFRSTANVERVWLQVATGGADADADADGGESYMRVQLQCSSGLRKKFDLAFQEVSSMNAVYDKAACPHTIRADPGRFLDCLKNFPTSQNEVTLVAATEALTLKNEVQKSAAAEGSPLDRHASSATKTEMRSILSY